MINTDATGTKGIAPSTNLTTVVINGILIDGASSNTIGGTAAGSSNVIFGNTYGVSISSSGASGNLVQGNFIGTDITGTKVLGLFLSAGVNVDSARNNTIGGTLGAAATSLPAAARAFGSPAVVRLET